MNEIIIIHWKDGEVAWIPKNEDNVKFLEDWQLCISTFSVCELSLQWKQFIKENKLLQQLEDNDEQ